ncbi:hypothetical protein ING2D1G_1477 [Peptoniphilus sp. ING2-D1G]|nr:hypothetical protein ING2D1G_1477 [Peptoniphilus sp. ING2-D1G]
MKDKSKNKISNFRVGFQILFTALTNGYALGFAKSKIYQGPTKAICLPGLNCYSCPGALGSCPIGALQAVATSKNFNISFYVLGFLMIIGSVIGRFVCGWMCPFGLLQDLLHKVPLKKKIKTFKGEKHLLKLKHLILLAFVIILPITLTFGGGYGNPWFCKVICPSGTLMGGIPLVLGNESLRNAIGLLFSWKVAILILAVLSSIAIHRPFCKHICPLGAIYGGFNKISLLQYTVDEHKCIKCNKCYNQCSMNVKIYEEQSSPECIRCGECVKVCPTKAVSAGFKK